MIIIAANTRGRTPTRGKSNARPLSGGMEISNICRGCIRTILAHIVAPAERMVGARTSHNRVGFTLGGGSLNHDPKPVRIKFARAFKAARRLSPLVKFFQKPTSGLTKSFQVLSLLPVHVVKHGRRTRQDAVTARQERGYE